MPTLSELINAKINDQGLTSQAAAAAIGVNLASLRGVTSGKRLPNKRSIDKYASFLELNGDEIKALVTADKPVSTAAKPAKGGKASKGARAAKGGKAAAALEVLTKAFKDAEALQNDTLAVRVHRLSDAQRKVVSAIIATF